MSSFCRKKSLELALISEIAYKSKEDIAREFEALEHRFFSGESTQAVAVVYSDEVIVAFRGTQQLADLKRDFDYKKEESLLGSVHRGFYAALREVLGEIIEYIEPHIEKKKLYVTGHSLGGALAVLLGAYVKNTMSADVEIYTFGQPRVFGKASAAHMEELIGGKLFRVVLDKDPIARVPSFVQGFSHIGRVQFFDGDGTLHIDASYWKRLMLIAYELGMSYFGGKSFLSVAKGIAKNHRIYDYISAIR